MGHYKNIKIDRSEGWKYSDTLGTNGDDYYARVYVDDEGNISKSSYSNEYNKKQGNDEKPNNKGKGNKKKDKKNEGCLTKILKAPFRLLWWLLKKALVILTFGILSDWLDKED